MVEIISPFILSVQLKHTLFVINLIYCINYFTISFGLFTLYMSVILSPTSAKKFQEALHRTQIFVILCKSLNNFILHFKINFKHPYSDHFQNPHHHHDNYYHY